MTTTEFETFQFTNKTVLKYKNKTYKVKFVDFEEGLIGLNYSDQDEVIVRYENCSLIPSEPQYPEGILSFKNKWDEQFHFTKVFNKYQEGVENHLESNDWEIHSCQSPVGILTVGDRFKAGISDEIYVVETFDIIKGKIHINKGRNGFKATAELFNVFKILPPVETFRTFDGKEVETDVMVYGIDVKSLHCWDAVCSPEIDNDKYNLYFSDPVLRDEYIADNKPIWSNNQIEKIICDLETEFGENYDYLKLKYGIRSELNENH